MSKFSNKLKELFSLKSVDKRIVAQALNMDRALLYRYMNDQSFPEDSGFIEGLKNELYLTPYEYKELQEAYEITKLGEDIYLNRQIVSEILEDLFLQSDHTFTQAVVPLTAEHEKFITLQNRDKIYSTLLSIIMDSRTDEILMNLQPDREFVFKSIFQILREKATQHTVQIEHLLRFQSKTSEDVNSYNLRIFSRLIPLLYYCTYYTKNIYYANYYYNNQAAVDERAMDLFPNILITPWCTIVMSFNYDNGIVYFDESISQIYKKNFESIKSNTFSFIQTNLASIKAADISERCRKNQYSEYIFKSHPSASLGLGNDYYGSDYLLRNRVEDDFVSNLTDYHKKIDQILYQDNHRQRKDFFTASGLRTFVETGKLSTFFSQHYRPLEPKDTIKFLERYVSIIENNPHFSAHLVQDDTPGMYNGSFGIYIFNENTLVIENSRRRVYNIASLIEVTERSIVNAFYDYLNNQITIGDSVMSRDETLAILKDEIQKLKSKASL